MVRNELDLNLQDEIMIAGFGKTLRKDLKGRAKKGYRSIFLSIFSQFLQLFVQILNKKTKNSHTNETT